MGEVDFAPGQTSQACRMIIDADFDAEKQIEFLAASIKGAGKQVFPILDHLRVHHSKPVKAWVAQRTGPDQ